MHPHKINMDRRKAIRVFFLLEVNFIDILR